ncbi:hypothetical protein [Dickeya phage Amaethon]|nr:hypothetical protein [Dickeya phage Amaethon]
MRVKHAHQCIGLHAEANERMHQAWALKPKSNQIVYILRANKFELEKWNFSWFTLCGARLYKSAETHYSTLINWDKGDYLFTDTKQANCQLVLRALTAKHKAERQVELYNTILEKAIKDL